MNITVPFIPSWLAFNDYANTVPQLYWNIESNEQRYHLLCKQLHKLVCYSDMLGAKINIDHDAIEKLQAEFDKFKESGFDDYYIEQIEKWVNANLKTLYHLLVKQVFFGLNLEGYFVAYIPDSWSDIVFDTGANYADDKYGRLILSYLVNSETETVEQP